MAVQISVVVPCRDGGEVLHAQLSALSRQTVVTGWEVVVADNGSRDDSANIVEQWAARDDRFRVIDASRRPGINVARNEGIRAARGRLVLFCDADDEVDSEWIESYASAHAQGAMIMGGRQHEIFRGRLLVTSGLRDSLGFLSWPLGANCAVDREVIDSVGLFDERYRGGGDETEFFWRAQLAGYELVEVPDAKITYRQRDSMREVFRQHVKYGQSNARLFAEFGDRGMPDPRPPAGALTVLKSGLRAATALSQVERMRYTKRMGLQLGAMTGHRGQSE